MRSVSALFTALALSGSLPRAAQQSIVDSKQDAEVMNYRLTMDKLRKLVAVYRELAAADAKNPRFFEELEDETPTTLKTTEGPLTVSQRAALIDRNAEAKRVFTQAGWNAREWLLTTEAMSNAYMSIEAKTGTIEAPPPATEAQKANVALLQVNDAEFKRIMEQLSQLTDQMVEE